ncbi:hypothetical protein GCM10010294_05000 [Streptomyces griseoloalbus]|uniref:DUF6087 family protein n=1 Tax=Streptomyces griseoloalbus TaxID=67303 RepID=UPI0019C59021|nr:hypothetical protein GCM10010294_05000 [Streptomyces griseoloalbus]
MTHLHAPARIALPRLRENTMRSDLPLVPFVVQREGEDSAPANLLLSPLGAGRYQLSYADEDPRDRDLRGVLWARCSFGEVDDLGVPTGKPQWRLMEHPVEDEPLDDWAARREQRRPAPGERRVFPLGEQQEQGTHVDPEAPRGIQEWDGHQWAPVGVAENRAATADEAGQDTARQAERVPLPRFSRLPLRCEPWRPTEQWHRPDPA